MDEQIAQVAEFQREKLALDRQRFEEERDRQRQKVQVERENLDLDRERLGQENNREQEKRQIEREQLTVDRRKTMWTSASVVISVLVGAATIWFGLHSQAETARAQFEMKAAEVVMSATDSHAVAAKARVLQQLFPERLSKGFAEALEKRATGEKIEKLDLEIEARLSQFLVDLEAMVKPNDETLSFARGFSINDIKKRWVLLISRPTESKPVMFAEFETRPLVPLVVELSRLVSKEDREELRGVAAALSTGVVEPGVVSIPPVLKRFHARVLLRRWSNLFPYTDCDVERPFC